MNKAVFIKEGTEILLTPKIFFELESLYHTSNFSAVRYYVFTQKRYKIFEINRESIRIYIPTISGVLILTYLDRVFSITVCLYWRDRDGETKKRETERKRALLFV